MCADGFDCFASVTHLWSFNTLYLVRMAVFTLLIVYIDKCEQHNVEFTENNVRY